MSTVAEIEHAIEKLDPKEIRRVGDWLDELRERLFDKQIDADAKSRQARQNDSQSQGRLSRGQSPAISVKSRAFAGILGLPRRIAVGGSKKNARKKFQTLAEKTPH